MESYYAQIIENIVNQVDVVDDDFFKSNPERYSGLWIKIGTDDQPFVGRGAIYFPEKNKIINPKPFDSWILDESLLRWIAPKPKPGENYSWNEVDKDWVLVL